MILLMISSRSDAQACFTKEEIGKIAQFKKECDVKSLDLVSAEKAFKECQTQKACSVPIYKSDTIIVSMLFTALIVGVSIGGKK